MGAEGPESTRLQALPILPLRNSVLFPTSVVPINVGRPRSVRLVQDLLGQERAFVGVVSQLAPETNEPTFDDLYDVGTIARVVKVIRLGPSNYSVVLNGLGRINVLESTALEPYMRAKVERVPERRLRDVELDALGATLRESTREVLSLMPNLPRETAGILDHVRDPAALADLIAAISATVGRPAHIDRLPMQPGDVPLTMADVSRARAELGYRPQTGLQEGLAAMWRWYTRR